MLIDKVKVEVVVEDTHVGETSNGAVELQARRSQWISWGGQCVILITSVSNSNVVKAIDHKMLKVVLMSVHVSIDSVFLHQGKQAVSQAECFWL